MKRRPGQEPRDGDGLTSEDRRIWSRVTGTVTPPRKRKAARVQTDAAHVEVMAQVLSALETRPAPKPLPKRKTTPAAPLAQTRPASPRPAAAPEDVEPNRKRRLTRERDPIEARIDLHGFGRFEAEDQLRGFLTASQARGMRAVLVITGQGRLGGGVIRAAFAEWMHAPALRSVVSGYTVAHQRHGGNGAFYVTLRRKG
jgi:DNA-nicking Smr family endonuclease